MPRPRDAGGYLPLEEYAVAGDGRSAAYVGVDGRIDWWAVPTLDAPPFCAALLDPERGGFLSLAPTAAARSRHHYIEGTNVVETVHETATGTVRVVDALNSGSAGRLPWSELARRIECVEGSVDMEWKVVPGDRLRRARPWVRERGGVPIITLEDQMAAVVTDGIGAPTVGRDGVGGRFVATPGRPYLLAVVVSDDEPLFVPDPAPIYQRVERSIESWRTWSAMVRAEGEYGPAVVRSALALKLLLAEETGAIAAAGTTSLPEGIGGTKNWDYRYAWTRDSSFAVDALLNLGLHEEAHGAVSWLLKAIRRHQGDIHVFYSLDGSMADDIQEIDVPGYRGSRPVRSGNSASRQDQLGTYGDLFDAIMLYAAEGHIIDAATGRMLSDLADRCCDQWFRPDSGIWELDDLQHYTISKIGCWVALDRAAQLGRAGQIPADRVGRWESVAAEIHEWVDAHCWSERRQSYTFFAGSEDLDAAVLLAGRTGFDRGARLSATIDAVRDELGRGPWIYRYTGMDKEEGAFVACSFWLVSALAHAGRAGEARELMGDLLGHRRTSLGLYAEQIDPDTGEFLGNLPQGLSHLALINAAHALGAVGNHR